MNEKKRIYVIFDHSADMLTFLRLSLHVMRKIVAIIFIR